MLPVLSYHCKLQKSHAHYCHRKKPKLEPNFQRNSREIAFYHFPKSDNTNGLYIISVAVTFLRRPSPLPARSPPGELSRRHGRRELGGATAPAEKSGPESVATQTTPRRRTRRRRAARRLHLYGFNLSGRRSPPPRPLNSASDGRPRRQRCSRRCRRSSSRTVRIARLYHRHSAHNCALNARVSATELSAHLGEVWRKRGRELCFVFSR